MGRRPLIGVMGAGEGAASEALRLAEQLGEAIARRGWALLSGGRPCGVMAAACRAAMAVPGHLVVGVLPDCGLGESREATAELDVALFTGMGQARNVINVLSSDVVVVCGAGGAGTMSEAAHALKAGRSLLLLATPPAWGDLLSSLGGDGQTCDSVAEVIDAIERRLATAEAPAARPRLKELLLAPEARTETMPIFTSPV